MEEGNLANQTIFDTATTSRSVLLSISLTPLADMLLSVSARHNAPSLRGNENRLRPALDRTKEGQMWLTQDMQIDQLHHDERSQQRKEDHGCPHCCSHFRDRTSTTPSIYTGITNSQFVIKMILTSSDSHHDRPEPSPGCCRRHRQLRSP